MVKKFGIAFLAILTVAALMVTNVLSGVDYLRGFLTGQSIGVIATVLALNVATVTFLIGNLLTIEQAANKELFSKTKEELKQNIAFMFVSFFLQALFVILVAAKYGTVIYGIGLDQVFIALALLCIVLVFFALVEIITAIFQVANFIKQK